MTQAHPLQWPHGRARTPAHKRENGRRRFARPVSGKITREPVSIGRAIEGLMHNLRLLGASDIVVSSNLRVRLDGLPYSKQGSPEDPGVAVYFVRNGDPKVLQRDAFTHVADNIRSLALALEGLRQLKLHGGAEMLNQAFKGFTALPPPGDGDAPAGSAWRAVLGLDASASLADAEAAYKRLSRKHGATLELNLAIGEARKELNNG